MTSRWEQRYWSVDAPGLSAAGAAELASAARRMSGVVGAVEVDPDAWLTQHLDRETVETLVSALSIALAVGGFDPSVTWGIQQLVEDLQGWLDETGGRSS